VRVRASESEEFRPANPGEVLFTPAVTTGARTAQSWKFEFAPGSGLSELSLVGELHTSAEGLAQETLGAAQQRLPLLRTSVGQSRSLRNNAVYDRQWDWLFSSPGDGATRIAQPKRQADALAFPWETHGPSLELAFHPLWFQQHRNLPHFKPWTYRVYKDSVSGWCSWWAYRDAIDAPQLTAVADALAAQRMSGFGLRWLQIDDGYQTGMGLPEGWLTWNAQKFPGGAEGVVELIRRGGFQPGVWVYSAFNDEAGAKQHPDWFVHDEKGALREGPVGELRPRTPTAPPRSAPWSRRPTRASRSSASATSRSTRCGTCSTTPTTTRNPRWRRPGRRPRARCASTSRRCARRSAARPTCSPAGACCPRRSASPTAVAWAATASARRRCSSTTPGTASSGATTRTTAT
jgi:hypothetical protein